MFLIGGLLVSHFLLKVATAKIATFIGICCAMQLAVTPWLFSARATPQNPGGRPFRARAAVVVLFSGWSLLFFYYLRRGSPEDLDTRRFTDIALLGTIVLAVALLVTNFACARRGGDQSTKAPMK
jgi:hypothetical protein